MSMSGRRVCVPKKLAWCLAGILALSLGVQACQAAAEASAAGQSPALLAATFDAPQESATPTTSGLGSTEPTSAPTTGPFLPNPAAEQTQQPGEISSTTGQGEIVPFEDTSRGPLRFSLRLLYMYGNVTGYAQTPKNHQTSSTSADRPKFDEIGIDTANIGDAEFGVSWGNSEIFFGAQYNHMSGSATLSRSLVSNGVTFPAHVNVNSDVRMDWYRLGYRYNFILNTAPNGVPDLTLAPMLDVFYWDYGYSVDAGRIGQTGQTLGRWGFQLGGTLAWRPYGGRFAIEGNLAAFPQNTRLANIASESVILRYRFYQYRRYDFDVLLGVAWQQESYNDKRSPSSNTIKADFGTMILTGIQMNF
jgi:hypothetical protein